MLSRVSLISVFVLLNLGVGRMFQESMGVVCLSELSIIGITGFFFWNGYAKGIKVWSKKWALTPSGKHILIHGGLGLSASFLNVVIGQMLIIFLMTAIYGCTSPSFNILQASLTNNIAVNLLCYFSLLFYFVGIRTNFSKSVTPVNQREEIPKRISVTKKGAHFLLNPEEIIFVETNNNCIVLHTDKGKFVKYQSLKAFSRSLCPKTFKRIHRSCLLNVTFMDCIKKNKNGDGTILLTTGTSLKFSRTYLPEISNL